jgi:hypothetical protein
MKKHYISPAVQVVTLAFRSLLTASPTQWGGEMGSRRYDDYQDD